MPEVYRYNEDKYLDELQDYIISTYTQHYSKNKYQATEFIIDSGHGEGFCFGFGDLPSLFFLRHILATRMSFQ